MKVVLEQLQLRKGDIRRNLLWLLGHLVDVQSVLGLIENGEDSFLRECDEGNLLRTLMWLEEDCDAIVAEAASDLIERYFEYMRGV